MLHSNGYFCLIHKGKDFNFTARCSLFSKSNQWSEVQMGSPRQFKLMSTWSLMFKLQAMESQSMHPNRAPSSTQASTSSSRFGEETRGHMFRNK